MTTEYPGRLVDALVDRWNELAEQIHDLEAEQAEIQRFVSRYVGTATTIPPVEPGRGGKLNAPQYVDLVFQPPFDDELTASEVVERMHEVGWVNESPNRLKFIRRILDDKTKKGELQRRTNEVGRVLYRRVLKMSGALAATRAPDPNPNGSEGGGNHDDSDFDPHRAAVDGV